jgi:hypothetical protein
MIKNIYDNILIRMGTLLTGYSKLSFVTNLEKNKFGQITSRYGLLTKGAGSNSEMVGKNVLDHKFEITLTNSFGANTLGNDDEKSNRINVLQDKCLEIYRDLQLNKSVIDSSILIINGIEISEPEFMEEEKIIIIKCSINVKYKV